MKWKNESRHIKMSTFLYVKNKQKKIVRHTSENNKRWKKTEKEQIVRRFFEELIGR